MRIVLADLASADGFVSKDTVVGGYGSRLRPFSRVTRMVCALKRQLLRFAQRAAWLHRRALRGGRPRGRLHDGRAGRRRRRAGADVAGRSQARGGMGRRPARGAGMRVGFVGLTASKLPELFEPHGDFVIIGRAGDGGHGAGEWRTTRGTCSESGSHRPRHAPVSAMGHRARRRTVARGLCPFRGAGLAAPIRCWPAAAAPSSAPIARTESSPLTERAALGTSSTSSSVSTSMQHQPFVVFRDPLFTERSRPVPGALR